MSQVAIGLECKAYLLTGTRATWGAATGGIHVGSAPSGLAELTGVRDVTVNLDSAEADVSTRASIFALARAALRKLDCDLEYPWSPNDANFTTLLGAYVNGTSVALAFLNGDKATSKSQGPWADWAVMTFTREEKIDGAVMAKVKLKPTSSAVPPEWAQVT